MFGGVGDKLKLLFYYQSSSYVEIGHNEWLLVLYLFAAENFTEWRTLKEHELRNINVHETIHIFCLRIKDTAQEL